MQRPLSSFPRKREPSFLFELGPRFRGDDEERLTGGIQRSARLAGGFGAFDQLVVARLNRHARLLPSAMQIVSGRQSQVDEGGDREAGPDRIGAKPTVGRENPAEAD